MSENKLWDALDYLREFGWMKNGSRDVAGRRCAASALHEAWHDNLVTSRHETVQIQNATRADHRLLLAVAYEQFPERSKCSCNSLAGTLTRDGEPITDDKEMQEVVLHWMRMTRDYEHEGFRFVDADAHGTLSQGFLSLNWSGYGLENDDTVPHH